MRKVGVLGLGSIGSRHAKNLKILGCEVLGHDPGLKLSNAGLEEALSTDAIVIATPTHRHAIDLLECLDVRKPLFLEKPVADTSIASSLLEHVKMVGYNLRFHSCVKKAKEWIDNGYIGKPIWASFTCAQFNDKPAYLRDGVILNWSHEIDLALYLLGPAELSVTSTRITAGKDDITDILLRHESGARSTVHLDYVTKPEIREAWICGDQNRIGLDLVGRRASLGEYIYQGTDSWDANYREEMQAFLDRVDGEETIGCTAAEGLAALKICLEAIEDQAGL